MTGTASTLIRAIKSVSLGNQIVIGKPDATANELKQALFKTQLSLAVVNHILEDGEEWKGAK